MKKQRLKKLVARSIVNSAAFVGLSAVIFMGFLISSRYRTIARQSTHTAKAKSSQNAPPHKSPPPVQNQSTQSSATPVPAVQRSNAPNPVIVKQLQCEPMVQSAGDDYLNDYTSAMNSYISYSDQRTPLIDPSWQSDDATYKQQLNSGLISNYNSLTSPLFASGCAPNFTETLLT